MQNKLFIIAIILGIGAMIYMRSKDKPLDDQVNTKKAEKSAPIEKKRSVLQDDPVVENKAEDSLPPAEVDEAPGSKNIEEEYLSNLSDSKREKVLEKQKLLREEDQRILARQQEKRKERRLEVRKFYTEEAGKIEQELNIVEKSVPQPFETKKP